MMHAMKSTSIVSIIFFIGTSAIADVSVNLSGYGVRIKTDDVAVTAKSSGTIDPDVQIEGVTIINDNVFVDGEKVPNGRSVFTSKKTKKIYIIQSDINGNISVKEK